MYFRQKYFFLLLEFKPRISDDMEITIGDYIEELLTELDCYGTRLPRLPILIDREIKAKINELKE